MHLEKHKMDVELISLDQDSRTAADDSATINIIRPIDSPS